VEDRLRLLGFSEGAIEGALARLAEFRFLDDARLARDRIEALVARGYGDLWITRDLARRGLGEALIAQALAAAGSEAERAQAWLAARGPRARPRAAWGMLVKRGFSGDAVEAVLGPMDALAEGEPDDVD
jgi:SOS response regulatory protein OraA/RecX